MSYPSEMVLGDKPVIVITIHGGCVVSVEGPDCVRVILSDLDSEPDPPGEFVLDMPSPDYYETLQIVRGMESGRLCPKCGNHWAQHNDDGSCVQD